VVGVPGLVTADKHAVVAVIEVLGIDKESF